MSDLYENIQTYHVGGAQQYAPEGTITPTVRNIGGVSEYRVQVDTSSPVGEHRSAAVQFNVGGVTTIGANGMVQTPAFQSYSADVSNKSNGDLFATARNGFFPARGDLRPDTVVKYQGMDVPLQFLESEGVVRRTATGYEMAPSGTTQGNQQVTRADPVEALNQGQELFSPVVEQQVAQAIDPIPQPLYDAAIARALEHGVESLNVGDLAAHSGLSIQEASARVQMVHQAFTKQADDLARARGIQDPSQVWDWARENRPEEFRRAQRDLAFSRNTGGLKALIGECIKSVPPSIESFKKAGYEVRTGHDGQELVKVQGVWMPISVAMNTGLVRHR